jgi:RNA polymerase-interacting CarD/CdnL/TRCF family regulator
MATTVQVSTELLQELKHRKIVDKESYEEVIWDLLEDSMELSEETKRDIEKARAEIKAGKTVSLAEVKKKIGL